MGCGRFSCSSLSLKQNLRHEPESRQVNACFTTLGSRAVACDFPPYAPTSTKLLLLIGRAWLSRTAKWCSAVDGPMWSYAARRTSHYGTREVVAGRNVQVAGENRGETRGQERIRTLSQRSVRGFLEGHSSNSKNSKRIYPIGCFGRVHVRSCQAQAAAVTDLSTCLAYLR